MTSILVRLADEDVFHHYHNMLYTMGEIFSQTLSQRTLSNMTVTQLHITGGMLYFYLYYEAKRLGLVQVDVNRNILKQFLKYKSTDLDMAGKLFTDSIDPPVGLSLEQIQDCFVTSMRLVPSSIFNHLHAILHNRPMVTRSPMIEPYFYLDTRVKLENGLVEFRPQCSVMMESPVMESHVDHIFECLLVLNMDHFYTWSYTLSGKHFMGESIVSSICDQLFPKERVWLLIPSEEENVWPCLNRLIQQNPVLRVKMRQGYWRSWMMVYIFEKAMLNPNAKDLLASMLCTHQCLARKSFYMANARRARLLFSNPIRQAARSIYQVARQKPPESVVQAEDVLKFLKLVITMYETCIQPYMK